MVPLLCRNGAINLLRYSRHTKIARKGNEMATLSLEDYCTALGLTHSQLATEVEKMSGLRMTRMFITDICHYKASERPPVALPKAQAIAAYISKEVGRTVTIADLGLKVM